MIASCKKSASTSETPDDTERLLAELEAMDPDYGGAFSEEGMFARSSKKKHDPREPEKFSARWVGREAAIVLRRAIAKEFEIASTSTEQGFGCAMFHEKGTVRRLIILDKDATHEYAMTAEGRIVFYYRASREKPPKREHWAFFHRGRLKLYQVRKNGGDRRTETAPEHVQDEVTGAMNICLTSWGGRHRNTAKPRAALPPPAPAPPPKPQRAYEPEGMPAFGEAYPLVAKHSGLCLEVVSGARAKGAKLTQSYCDGSRHQQFRIWEEDDGARITVDHTGFCLDVDGSSKNDRAPLVQRPCQGEPNQQFSFKPWDDGSYSLAAGHSKKCLDVSGAQKKPGAEVFQYRCGGGSNQRWLFGDEAAAKRPKEQKDSTRAKEKAAEEKAAKEKAAKEKARRARRFTRVEPKVWAPRLGPKMQRGSEVVHAVFEGPFGPSPRSLFAVTRRRDDTFFVLVVGDDGKGWPAGPLADPKLDRPAEVKAVSFFDADKNGTLDALVMATYMRATAHEFYINVLLTWTPHGLRRLLKLEPKIKHLESVAAVKRALGV